MIKRLELKDYGKFKSRSFEFAPVTVFVGPNEAGKTTLFDALTDVICGPLKGKTEIVRNLRERYGSERKVSVEFKPGQRIRLSVDEFLGLYAIRGGDIAFNISDSASWMAAVKANLFAGGVNPQHLKGALETLASTDGTLRHNRELRKAEAERDAAERELAELRACRDEILRSEEQIRRDQTALELKLQELQSAKEHLATLSARLKLQERIRQRRQLENVDRKFREMRELQQRLLDARAFATDRIAELDQLANTTRKSHEQLEQRRRDLATSSKRLEELRQELRRAEHGAAAGQSLSVLASSLLDRIAEAERLSVARPKRRWRGGVVIACISVAALSSILAAVAPWSVVLRIVCTVIAIIGLALVATLGTCIEIVPDENLRREYLERYLDEWNNVRPAELRAEIRTMEGLKQLLMESRAQATAAQAALDRTRKQLIEEEQIRERTARECEETERNLAAAQQAERQWLESLGVASRDEYVSKVAEYRAMKERFARVKEELEMVGEELGFSNNEDLERETIRRLRDMDETAVPRTGMSEHELQTLQREHDSTAAAAEALQNVISALQRKIGERTGQMQGSLGQLPRRIAAAARAKAEAESHIAELTLKMRAAGLAAELVGALCEQTDLAFEDLAATISDEFSAAMDHRRMVSVSGLNRAAIAVSDAGGTVRPVELLSRGTRDCFVLAARLALVRRAGGKKGILVLDEPFLSLDDTRRRQAVWLLKRFRQQTMWQLVVFTKEPTLVKELTQAFSDDAIVKHELEV